jgi:hypothetical protein
MLGRPRKSDRFPVWRGRCGCGLLPAGVAPNGGASPEGTNHVLAALNTTPGQFTGAPAPFPRTSTSGTRVQVEIIQAPPSAA